MKRLHLALCLALCWLISPGPPCPQARAAEAQAPAAMQPLLRQGVDKAFNLEIQAALDLFQRAVELDRGNPLPHAFLAMTHLFSYELSFEAKVRTSRQEAMQREIGETLTAGQKRLEANSRDGQAAFAVALAKIVKIRWAITERQYLAIAQEITGIWSYLEKARAADPGNDDVSLLMGLLHYHLDHLPAPARLFSSLLVAPADHQKGLQEIALTAQKGNLLKELAQAELASDYIYYEAQPAQALAPALAIKERFPRNYNFAFSLSLTFAELQRFPEAVAVAAEIEKGIQSAKEPYVPQLQPRLDHLFGRILFNQGRYDEAADRFQKAMADTSVYNARNRVSSLVRLGMIHDLRKERPQAQECYQQALQVEAAEGSNQAEARKYLKSPYTPPPNGKGT